MHDSTSSTGNAGNGSGMPHVKRLGGYLVEAGLLTPSQVDVALNDQQMTGMRFGEILAARGWVKQQTIEYLMNKVIIPEQRSLQARTNAANRKHPAPAPSHPTPEEPPKVARREVPVSKPLPSVPTGDDVSWVG